MKLLMAAPLIVMLASCSMEPTPVALDKVRVVSGPSLIKRGDQYFLRYRRALDKEYSTLVYPVGYKRTDKAGFYYFYGPVSNFYHGQMIELPLVYNEGLRSSHGKAASFG